MHSERRSYDRLDEEDLVAFAKGGDERAFAALVSTHRVMLYTVCFRIAGSRHDAEDAVQLALLAAWRHLDRFEGRSSFSTWLYRIGCNAALGLARKRVPEPVADEGATVVVANVPHPDDTVADTDAVRRALDRIPPEFRAALVLREFAGLSYREIAEATGVRVETVKTRISRARQALARLLEMWS
jgi:RNA polymerase sigma-70 factor (ECF subfamily)